MSVVVEGVGISVNRRPSTSKNEAAEIQAAMEGAVLKARADGVNDPDAVKDRIMAARAEVKARYAAAG
jgi:hypothetical protein